MPHRAFAAMAAVLLTLAWSIPCRALDPSTTRGTIDLAVASAPPVPEGFASADAVMEAVRSGKVPLLDRNPAAAGVTETPDVPFESDGVTLKLDVYAPPADVKRPVPGLVFLHGGGWQGGSRKDIAVYAREFASRGYVVVSPQYRLSTEAPYPAALHDVRAAIRWLRTHAATYGVDPGAIGLSGWSAGAHLALLAAYAFPATGEALPDGANDGIRAVVDFYGPTDLTLENVRDIGVVAKFLGAPWAEARDRYADASPLAHVGPTSPPTLIFHGTVDNIVPVAQADLLADKLAQAGVPYFYDRIGGWPHTMDLAAAIHARALALMERFYGQFLKPHPTP